jgi:chromosome segregation ATPase
MIASLKGYSRIARILLGILGGLLIVGIIGSVYMGVRAKRTAQDMVVTQAQAIADSSLSLLFQPSDLTAPVSAARADELSTEIKSVVTDPSDFDSVTMYSPEGTVLYSTDPGRIGNELPGEKDQIKEALKDDPQVSTYQGTVSILLPFQFRSGVGAPAAVELTRSDAPIASADNPWNTNAMFLFGMLIVLGLAVFGVARLLQVAQAQAAAADLPRATAAPAPPVARPMPQPGLREEGEARRKAEDRARAAEERLALLQDQYRKSLEELQNYRDIAREPRGPSETDLEERALIAEGSARELEERALHAEGTVKDLELKVQTLDGERAKLSEQLRDALRVPVDADAGRVAALEAEAVDLRAELDVAKNELRDAIAHADRAGAPDGADARRLAELETEASQLRAELALARTELREAIVRAERPDSAADDPEVRAELDSMHVELLRTKDDLTTANTIADRARLELDDARTELRALRNEEQRAAMLEDELRAAKAELESREASYRADLVEREADLEEKVRETREAFQQQLTDMEASYRAQVQQAETQLADRILEAEATARRAAAELETARVDLDAMRDDLHAARSEAESREQRVLQAHEELLKARQETKDLAKEIKERSTTVAQAHKDTDDIRRALAVAQADLARADGAIDETRAELDMERQRAEQADQAATVAARERDHLQERIDKLIRQLDDAAADNQELNRRLQDFEARRQLELADDQGRAEIDELLRVTQERLAGQTEKLITAEDRVRDLEAEVATATERADVAEAENRTHQMSDALREMREQDVATTRDAAVQREASAAMSDAIEAGALEDRRSASPLLRELSVDAKRSLAKIDGITKLLKHKKDTKDQAQLMKQLATYTRRLDHAVGDIADAEKLANGTIELSIKRADMEALVNRVVEESSADADHDIRVVADPLKLRIDAQRTERIVSGLLQTATERTQGGKTIVVRLQQADGGATISIEDPGQPSEAAVSPIVRTFAEIQGGTIKAEPTDGGTAFRVFLPDGAGTGAAPKLQITVDEVEGEQGEPEDAWEAEAAHQELAAELRRFAQLQGDAKA